jgi:hypothetical protein
MSWRWVNLLYLLFVMLIVERVRTIVTARRARAGQASSEDLERQVERMRDVTAVAQEVTISVLAPGGPVHLDQSTLLVERAVRRYYGAL